MLIGAGVFALLCLCTPAYAQVDNIALMLQQTPVNGGTINPGLGVHQFDPDAEITLTATPRQGYQFIYWIGDVSDPDSSTTTVYLDAPKIIVAVFERTEYDMLVSVSEMSQSRPRGGSFVIPAAQDYSNQQYTGGGAKRPHKFRWPTPPEPEEEDEFPTPDSGEQDFPVPDNMADDDFPTPDPEGDDFPVPSGGDDYPGTEPVPEPATVLLFAAGSLLALNRRKNNS